MFIPNKESLMKALKFFSLLSLLAFSCNVFATKDCSIAGASASCCKDSASTKDQCNNITGCTWVVLPNPDGSSTGQCGRQAASNPLRSTPSKLKKPVVNH